MADAHVNSLMKCAGEVFSELISSLELSGIKYTVLYVSDPFRSIQYPSYRDLERFLAEGTYGNGSFNSTCDEVCQIKSSLLEGLFVVSFDILLSMIQLLTPVLLCKYRFSVWKSIVNVDISCTCLIYGLTILLQD